MLSRKFFRAGARPLVFFLAVLAATALANAQAVQPPAGAQANEPEFSEIYRLAPITSELQRHILNAPHAEVYVAVWGNSLLDQNGAFVPTRTHWEQLTAAIQKLAPQDQGQPADPVEGRVVLEVMFSPPPKDRDVDRTILDTYRGCGERIGYPKPVYRGRYSSDDPRAFTSETARLLETPDPAGTKEENIGSETLRIYPIRTHLSHYLTSQHTYAYLEIREPTTNADWPLSDSDTAVLSLQLATLAQELKAAAPGEEYYLHGTALIEPGGLGVSEIGTWLMSDPTREYFQSLGFAGCGFTTQSPRFRKPTDVK